MQIIPMTSSVGTTTGPLPRVDPLTLSGGGATLRQPTVCECPSCGFHGSRSTVVQQARLKIARTPPNRQEETPKAPARLLDACFHV